MARVTVSEVRVIYTTSLSDDAIEQFIETANLIVDDRFSDSDYSEAKLKQIELYLSAHFASCGSGGQLKRRKIGEAEDEYSVAQLEGLESTIFGQTALMLDNDDYLEISDSKKCTIQVI